MRLILLTFCCAATILLVGCSDDTNSVGNKLIQANEKFTIADTTFQAVMDTAYNVSYPNGYGTYTVAGKTNDVEAKAWLRFTSSALADSLGSCTIDTVQLHITVGYTYNNPAPYSEFQIREATTGWTQGGATRDSLPMMEIGTTVLGRISDSLLTGREIVVPLDSTSARRWIRSINDTLAARMYGYVIMAKPGTAPGAFGYYSSTASSYYPKLVIHFVGTNGVRDSLSFIYSEDTFIATSNVTTTRNLEVRGGVSTWSKLQFNVSSLSKAAIINNASLELTEISGSTTLGVGTPDSLYAYIAKSGGTVATIDSTYRLLGKRKDTTTTVDPVYVFTVTPYIQFLIAPGSPYDGIVLHAAYNNGSLEHRMFYSMEAADPTKRPRLVVTSSKQ
jgi:hypothetical protein